MSKDRQPAPYVVSGDVGGSMIEWGRRTGYGVPESDYFDGALHELGSVLGGYFKRVEMIPEKDLRFGINRLVRESKSPVVSIDRVYVDDEGPNVIDHLDFTRGVNEDLEGIGLIPRDGFQPINLQIAGVARACNRKGVSEIAIVDDVVFSGGDLVGNIIPEFEKQGIAVTEVLAGVAIGSGIETIESSGVGVRYVYKFDKVEDEVCERDFVAGVPHGGREMKTDNGQRFSVPYFLPFSNPGNWASIPERYANDFSRFCMEQSIHLWREVEKRSKSSVPVRSVPRAICGIRQNGQSIVKALEARCNIRQ